MPTLVVAGLSPWGVAAYKQTRLLIRHPSCRNPHHVEGGLSVNGKPYFLDAGTGGITQLSLWKRFQS